MKWKMSERENGAIVNSITTMRVISNKLRSTNLKFVL